MPLTFRITSAYWRLLAAVLGSLHVSLALIVAVLSVLVAAKPPFLADGEAFYRDLAAVGAVCNAVLLTLSARDRGFRYRKAHCLLRDEIARYEQDSSFGINDLIVARQKGLAMIDTHQQERAAG